MWLFWEIGPLERYLRLNAVMRVGPWSNRISVLIRKQNKTKQQRACSVFLKLCVCTHWGKAMWGHCLQARKRTLTRNWIGILVLDLCSPKLWENKFLLFKPTVSSLFYGSPRRQRQFNSWSICWQYFVDDNIEIIFYSLTIIFKLKLWYSNL